MKRFLCALIIMCIFTGISLSDVQSQGLSGSWMNQLNLLDGGNQAVQTISAVCLDQALQDHCAILGQTVSAMVTLNASNSGWPCGGGNVMQFTGVNGGQTQYNDPMQLQNYGVDVTQLLLGPGNKVAATSAIVAGNQTMADGYSFLGQSTFIGITEFASGVGTQIQNADVMTNQYQGL